MKKLLIAAAAMLSFCFADAQVYYLGFQQNKFKSETTIGSTTHTDKETAPGFVIGLGKNFEIADGLGIQPAIEMSLNSFEESSVKTTNFGFKAPIDINYGFELGSALRLGVFAGPTFYFGAYNKAKWDDNKMDLYEDALNRFSLGANAGAFCDILDLLRVKVGFDMGLSNLDQDGDDDYKYKQNCLTIAVGYLF